MFGICRLKILDKIIDTATNTVSEISTISTANWGSDSTAVVGNKVVMGPGTSGNSILIIDTTTDTVMEKDGTN